MTVLEAASGPTLLAMIDELEEAPDLVVVDMQMGNMGGMAVCLELRLRESYLDVDHIPVLLLLDRRPDVFLARRSGAEGWLVKPLDPLRLRRATRGPARRRHATPTIVPAGAGVGRGGRPGRPGRRRLSRSEARVPPTALDPLRPAASGPHRPW